jgi:hypothetical protein
MSARKEGPTGGTYYWEDLIVKRLKKASAAERAIIIADELEAAAEIYRAAPFPVVATHPADEAKIEAIRKVAQLARTAAKELRSAAARLQSDGAQ